MADSVVTPSMLQGLAQWGKASGGQGPGFLSPQAQISLGNTVSNINPQALNPSNNNNAFQGQMSSLQNMLSSMPQFQAVAAPGAISVPTNNFQYNPYQAKDMSQADLPQYDAMRQRLDKQYSQQQSQAQDSLDRQFAAMGGGPGNGAQEKQTENLATGMAQQKGNDLMNINAQEAQQRTALQQQEDQKAFQSGEAGKGMQFQADQLAAQQGMQAQEFNTQNQMAANQYNQQMQQQQNQFNFNAGANLANLGMANQQQAMDRYNTAFNAAVESKKMGDNASLQELMNAFLANQKGNGY